jgi:hypothetical protein
LSHQNQTNASDFRDWSIAAVRLLQGVIYSDDVRTWEILVNSRSAIEGYFNRIGLALVVDDSEGFAYLRQWLDDEYPAGCEELPKLVRRTPLSYGQTLLAVILRDELRRFEEADLHNDRCVIEISLLFEQWKPFFPRTSDEQKSYKEFTSCLSKLEDIGFVRRLDENPPVCEIRRILKARLPAGELEALKDRLVAAATMASHGG